uniref:Secreted protein n=1 Tax=Photinus pyralis TaxID=7054 RepID=A0A1Y1K8C8_PHOPY
MVSMAKASNSYVSLISLYFLCFKETVEAARRQNLRANSCSEGVKQQQCRRKPKNVLFHRVIDIPSGRLPPVRKRPHGYNKFGISIDTRARFKILFMALCRELFEQDRP